MRARRTSRRSARPHASIRRDRRAGSRVRRRRARSDSARSCSCDECPRRARVNWPQQGIPPLAMRSKGRRLSRRLFCYWRRADTRHNATNGERPRVASGVTDSLLRRRDAELRFSLSPQAMTSRRPAFCLIPDTGWVCRSADLNARRAVNGARGTQAFLILDRFLTCLHRRSNFDRPIAFNQFRRRALLGTPDAPGMGASARRLRFRRPGWRGQADLSVAASGRVPQRSTGARGGPTAPPFQATGAVGRTLLVSSPRRAPPGVRD